MYEININARDIKKKTPLHYAAKYNKYDAIRIPILNSNIYIDAFDDKGITVFLIASKYGFLDIIHFLLLLQNIDVNHQNIIGVNLLYFVLSFITLLRIIFYMKLNYFNHIQESIQILKI